MRAVQTLYDNHVLALRAFNLEVDSGLAGVIVETGKNALAIGRLNFVELPE